MRINPDLIRLVLLEGEKEEPVDLSSYSEDQINYHRVQLINAGYATGPIYSAGRKDAKSPAAEIMDLTWAGHNFLTNARNDTVWYRAKDEIARHGGNIGLKVLEAIVTRFALDMFK
jgi:hypothetical protein